MSSTFRKPTAFRPTPSTCYPPPPPPPLPYDVPCLRGQPRFVMQARGKIQLVADATLGLPDLYLPFNGNPSLGSYQNEPTWWLNLATPQIPALNARLTCGHGIAGSRQWWSTGSATTLPNPIPFTYCLATNPQDEPIDHSQLDGYTDVRATIPLVPTQQNSWTPTTLFVQWFTVGAPTWIV